ncbi:hypothetical protein VV869_20430 [Photobacterium sp. MCCC 1A19761]
MMLIPSLRRMLPRKHAFALFRERLQIVSLLSALLLFVLLLFVSLVPGRALASQSPPWERFPWGMAADAVGSLPDAYDCSELYPGQSVICLDRQRDFQLEDGALAVFTLQGKVHHLELTAPLTQANYTQLLAQLRRQGLVFAHLDVAGETLDVLSGMQSLDRQTLDDQMFALANRSSYLTTRTYLLVENRVLADALRQGYRNIRQWLAADGEVNPALQRVPLVTLQVSPEQLITRITYPFAE